MKTLLKSEIRLDQLNVINAIYTQKPLSKLMGAVYLPPIKVENVLVKLVQWNNDKTEKNFIAYGNISENEKLLCFIKPVYKAQ